MRRRAAEWIDLRSRRGAGTPVQRVRHAVAVEVGVAARDVHPLPGRGTGAPVTAVEHAVVVRVAGEVAPGRVDRQSGGRVRAPIFPVWYAVAIAVPRAKRTGVHGEPDLRADVPLRIGATPGWGHIVRRRLQAETQAGAEPEAQSDEAAWPRLVRSERLPVTNARISDPEERRRALSQGEVNQEAAGQPAHADRGRIGQAGERVAPTRLEAELPGHEEPELAPDPESILELERVGIKGVAPDRHDFDRPAALSGERCDGDRPQQEECEKRARRGLGHPGKIPTHRPGGLRGGSLDYGLPSPIPGSADMINVNTRQGRAAVLILLLGLGLLMALAPFASGLLAAPVLYVVFGPIYARLARRLRPSVAGGLTVTAGILLILVPGSWLLALIVGQAQNVIANLVQNPHPHQVADAHHRRVRGRAGTGQVRPDGRRRYRARRLRRRRDRHPDRVQPGHRLLRALLHARDRGQRLARHPALHPLQHRQRGAASGALPGGHHLDGHRHRPHGHHPGADGRRRVRGSRGCRTPSSGAW